jgi:hypothetical protein
MQTQKIALGTMWKSEATGEVYIVTSFCRDVFSSYACLRNAQLHSSDYRRKAKMVKTDLGETLTGFRPAETV